MSLKMKTKSNNKYKLRKHNKIHKKSKTRKTRKTCKTCKTRKIKGGFFNISKRLDNIKEYVTDLVNIKEYVKNRFINILLHGQTPIVQEKIRSKIENSIENKKIDIKIDLFIDRIKTLIQRIVQTITTTTVKVTTSWVPGLSFFGAILTTVINWTVIYVKMLARGYDLYNLYNEMKGVIEKSGGEDIDVSSQIGDLQKQAIEKVANATVPQQLKKVK